jgi:predicted alpha/beta-fold hydrolase
LTEFDPLFRNRHVATIAANFWPRDFSHDPYPETPELIPTEPDVRVLAYHQRPRSAPWAHAILVHGLEGSHASGYMISMAQTLLNAGLAVTRLNMRSCGGSEAYCRTLYHAGLTADLAAVVRRIHGATGLPVFLVGFSLGGNVVLKFAGESGSSIAGVVAGAAGVSTPIDLDACCRQMMRLENRLYEARFVSRLKERYRRRHAQFPDIFPIGGLDRVRSVYEFDDRFTARHFQFGDAQNYYRTQSSARYFSQIAVPTLIVQAQDDPLIPFRVFRDAAIESNPSIELLATPHGGHVGFLSRRLPRFWIDHAVTAWIARRMEQSGAALRLPIRARTSVDPGGDLRRPGISARE